MLMILSSFIKDSKRMKNFCISGAATFNLSAASLLSDAIMDHPSLERIGFIRCGLDANIIRKVLEGVTRARVFGLSCQKLGLESVNVIAGFIRSNQLVEILQMSNNNMSNNDASLLTSALENNTNLKRLNLKHNDITDTGEKTLLRAWNQLSSPITHA